MASSPALEADWLGACRAAAQGCARCCASTRRAASASSRPGTPGEGGDRTLVIDQPAEDIVFAELERLHDAGARFTAVSEERGVVDFGDDGVLRRDRPDRRLDERQARADPPRAVDRGRRRADDGRRALRLRARPRPGRGVVGARGGGRVPRRRAGRPAARAAHGRRAARARRDRVGVDPRWLAASSDALVRRRAPRARDRLDRDLAVPGRGDARRRHGDAVEAAARSTPRRRS